MQIPIVFLIRKIKYGIHPVRFPHPSIFSMKKLMSWLSFRLRIVGYISKLLCHVIFSSTTSYFH